MAVFAFDPTVAVLTIFEGEFLDRSKLVAEAGFCFVAKPVDAIVIYSVL